VKRQSRTLGRKALRKTGALLALFFGLAVVALGPRPAVAGSSSALVTVSVRVVESCRVEIASAAQGDAADLRMRCSATARPSLGLVGSSRPLAPVSTVTLPHAQIAATENGKTLSIQF